MGYNRFYIYLEDLFEVKNEPFFGYLRGRYSQKELKELDDYCCGFGIELVPCLQTLAHLNAIFKWPEYENCIDTADILLVGEQRTYSLIQNMFETVAQTFHTKTIHVGMDEAHLLGRGKFLYKNGYKNGFDFMSQHIDTVSGMAQNFGFNLMIWSDMYFRLAFGEYYPDKGTLPVGINIPDNMAVVYWDYFNTDKQTVARILNEHLKLSDKVVFAGGAWKWTGLNPSTKLSLLTSAVALDQCLKSGIKDIFLK